MPLASGSPLGPYTIVSLIGRGGMGEVYQARDSRLKRDVAIKILPDVLAGDAARLSRFEREAQILASLNHPRIGAIYGIEAHGRHPALVLELVRGETLADRLRRGSVPVEDALAIARQVAEALEAAHDHHIVHRDLKPANITLTPEGAVKVLDFGIAKALDQGVDAAEPGSAETASAPTIAAPATTQAGMILGTAAYMSPEQARGRPATVRSDVWAFGCVLYEMLAGRPAFDGTDAAEVLARVLERDVDYTALPSNLPAPVARLIRRCLAREPKQRIGDIGVARLEIDDAITAGIAAPATGSRRVWLATAAAGIVVAAVAAWSALQPPAPAPPAGYQAAIPAPPGTSFPLNDAQFMAVSADGRRLALVATGRLWVRSLAGATSRPLDGTNGATDPFWSPDGRNIAFFASGRLQRVDADGGPVVTLATDAAAAGGAWNQDDVILFRHSTGPLHRVAASGGPSEPVTTLESAETAHGHPAFLPDGQHFIYSAIGGTPGGALAGTGQQMRGVFVASLGAEDRTRLMDAGLSVQYSAGHLLFLVGSALMAQPFDPNRRQLSGTAIQIADRVLVGNPLGRTGAFTASPGGMLLYRPGTAAVSRLTWFNREGEPEGSVGEPAEIITVDLSPDGSKVAAIIADPATRTRDIWLFDDLARGVPTRFTFDEDDEGSLAWAPDGMSLAYDSARSGSFDIYTKAVDATTPAQALVNSSLNERPFSWSPDGRHLIYEAGSADSPELPFGDIWVLPSSNAGRPFAFLATPFNEVRPQFSPDGGWVAYESNESGLIEVYLARFPGGDGRVRVSQGGGSMVRWAHDGQELYFLARDNALVAAPVRVSARGAQIGLPRALFRAPVKSALHPYDVSPDGSRFLMNVLADDTASALVTLVTAWPSLLLPAR